jgi:hypothetical protein
MRLSDKLNEGPLDFMRGAGQELGNKVANSAPVRAGRQVIQAGRNASNIGEMEKAVAEFAAALAYIQKVKGEEQSEEPPQKPLELQAGRPQPAPQQDSPQQSNAPFTPAQKPRMVMKNGQQQYQFSSFMQAVHGEQLDEGVWDFAKGVAGAAGDQIRNKINDYASKPSIFKDIYAAGQQASADGNQRKQENVLSQKLAQAQAQTKTLLSKLLDLAKTFGDQAPAVLTAAIKKAGGTQAAQIMKLVAENGPKRGVDVQMPTQ